MVHDHILPECAHFQGGMTERMNTNEIEIKTIKDHNWQIVIGIFLTFLGVLAQILLTLFKG